MNYEDFGLLYAFNSFEHDSNDGYHYGHIAEWYLSKLLRQYGL